MGKVATHVNYALNVGKARDTAVTVPSPARRQRMCTGCRLQFSARSHGHPKLWMREDDVRKLPLDAGRRPDLPGRPLFTYEWRAAPNRWSRSRSR